MVHPWAFVQFAPDWQVEVKRKEKQYGRPSGVASAFGLLEDAESGTTGRPAAVSAVVHVEG